MGAKLLVALLLIALVFVFFKFMREREARLRERARMAERLARERGAEATGNSSRQEGGDTVDMRRDPKTGVFIPADDDGKGKDGGG